MTKVTEEYPGKGAELTNKEIAEQALRQHQQQISTFPTEWIDLPTRGRLYPEDSPLALGRIEMRLMTAKDEDILTSANLIKKGLVFDALMKSLIVTPINYDELLIADKNAILIASRILGYGKDYTTEVTCPACETKQAKKFDLTSLEDKQVDESVFENGNDFSFTLPNSGKEIKFRLLTHADETAIDQEITKLKKFNKSGVDPTVTTRLFYSITAVDGNTDRKAIRDFVNRELLAYESRALRNYISEVTPTVDTQVFFDCDECGHEEYIDIPIDVNFFWPKA